MVIGSDKHCDRACGLGKCRVPSPKHIEDITSFVNVISAIWLSFIFLSAAIFTERQGCGARDPPRGSRTTQAHGWRLLFNGDLPKTIFSADRFAVLLIGDIHPGLKSLIASGQLYPGH